MLLGTSKEPAHPTIIVCEGAQTEAHQIGCQDVVGHEREVAAAQDRAPI